jgi:hypothetical protein
VAVLPPAPSRAHRTRPTSTARRRTGTAMTGPGRATVIGERGKDVGHQTPASRGTDHRLNHLVDKSHSRGLLGVSVADACKLPGRLDQDQAFHSRPAPFGFPVPRMKWLRWQAERRGWIVAARLAT